MGPASALVASMRKVCDFDHADIFADADFADKKLQNGGKKADENCRKNGNVKENKQNNVSIS
jgi:hypothetical protein